MEHADAGTELPEMVSEAKKEMTYLFPEANRQFWSLSYPPSVAGPTLASEGHSPSTAASSPRLALGGTPQRPRARPPSSRSYEVLPISALKHKSLFTSVVDQIGEGVDRLFGDGPSSTKPFLHNASFWTRFFHSLVIEISGGLMVRPDHVRSEAEVRCELITRRVADSMATLNAPEGFRGGSSVLNLETKTELRPHLPGSKPKVDYAASETNQFIVSP